MITITCIIFIVILILLGIVNNKDKEDYYCTIILLLIILFAVLISVIFYKQGQIDALSGNIKYELIENADKTREWKLK